MSATHETRIKRLDRLAKRVSAPGTGASACINTRQLLEWMGQEYGKGDEKTRLRSLQFDLKALVEAGRIEVANPGGKPLVYRRCASEDKEDPLLWQYMLEQMQALVADRMTQRQLDHLWASLQDESAGALLDAGRLRVVPDTLRLQPAEVEPNALRAVLTALAGRCALHVHYENARGERSKPCLHPQALVQRGPISYLFALKNDETELVRLYALHRMISAEVLLDVPAHEVEGFDLHEAIADGVVDFGRGERIDLELRVRGYLTEVITACSLAPEQEWEDEPDGSDFDIRVRASVPLTGQLLRWLLGAGANVEVIAPHDLRQIVASQAGKVADIYAASSASAPGGESGVSSP